MISKQTALARNIATSKRGWAPRLAQEARLTEIEALLAQQPQGNDKGDDEVRDTIELAVERAALLGALNRRGEAQQAFIELLRRAPAHFGALNQFGALLTEMGAIDAACRVYAEAVLHHRA